MAELVSERVCGGNGDRRIVILSYCRAEMAAGILAAARSSLFFSCIVAGGVLIYFKV